MRYTQPQSGPITLDPGNPIARGVDVAFVRLDQPGIVGSAQLTKAGSPSLIATKYGQGWYFGAAGGNYFQASGWPVLPDGTEYTILVVAQLNVIGTTDHLVDGDPGGPRQFQTRVETNGAPSIIGFNTAVANTQAIGTPMVIGVPQALVFRCSSTTLSVFQQGVKTGTTTFTGTAKGIDSTNITIGSRASSTNLHGSIGLVVRWPRALSDDEAKAVTANPWQLFRSPQHVYAPSVGGSQTYSYTAAGGFVLSGTTPPIRGTVKTATGGLTVSGTGPAVRGAVRTPSGGVSLSGTALTLRGRVLAGLGGLSFSGAASLVFTSAVQSLTVTPVGGLLIRGTSAMVRTVVRAVSGGITFAGHGATTFTPDPNPPTAHPFKRGRRPRTRKNY